MKKLIIGDWVEVPTGEQGEVTRIDREYNRAKVNDKFWFEFDELELLNRKGVNPIDNPQDDEWVLIATEDPEFFRLEKYNKHLHDTLTVYPFTGKLPAGVL